MSETKAPWKLAWEREFIGAASLLAEWEPTPEHEQAVGQYHAFKAGYLAATESRAPAVPGVVTREHRGAAWSALYKGQSTKEGSEWIENDADIAPNEALVRLSQALADAEARGRAQATPPAGLTLAVQLSQASLDKLELTAEVARLKAENLRLAKERLASYQEIIDSEVERLSGAIKLLLQYKALGRPMPLAWLEREFGDSVRDAAPPADRNPTPLLATDAWLRKGIASDGDVDTEAGLPLPLFEPTPIVAEPLTPESFQAAAAFHAAPPADLTAEVAGLLAEVADVRYLLEMASIHSATREGKRITREHVFACLDRLEQHLKGKR